MREIKKPSFMQEAAGTKRHSAFGEMVIFILLYVVAVLVESIGMVPALIAYFLQSPDAGGMLGTGNVDAETLNRLLEQQPEWLMIYTLFTEILLIGVYLFYCRIIEQRRFGTMGFRRAGITSMYGGGLLIGAVMFGAAYFLCVLTGSVRMDGLNGNMIPVYIVLYFGGYMIQGMAEEIICRGYLLVSLSRSYSVMYSAILSSLVFMMMHFANDGMTALSAFNLFLFGMFMALLFIKSGNIWIVAAVHTIWNFMQGNVFGVSVSGLAGQNSIFSSTLYSGRDVINGGDFGLEGGLAVTAVLVIAISVVYRRLEKSEVRPIQTEETVSSVQSVREENTLTENKKPSDDMSDSSDGSGNRVGESGKRSTYQTVFHAGYFTEDDS